MDFSSSPIKIGEREGLDFEPVSTYHLLLIYVFIRCSDPNEKDKVEALLDYELVCQNNPVHPSLAKIDAKLAGEGEVADAKQIFRRALALS